MHLPAEKNPQTGSSPTFTPTGQSQTRRSALLVQQRKQERCKTRSRTQERAGAAPHRHPTQTLRWLARILQSLHRLQPARHRGPGQGQQAPATRQRRRRHRHTAGAHEKRDRRPQELHHHRILPRAPAHPDPVEQHRPENKTVQRQRRLAHQVDRRVQKKNTQTEKVLNCESWPRTVQTAAQRLSSVTTCAHTTSHYIKLRYINH